MLTQIVCTQSMYLHLASSRHWHGKVHEHTEVIIQSTMYDIPGPVGGHQYYGGMYHIHLQGGDTLFQNTSYHPQDHMVSQPRSPPMISSPPTKQNSLKNCRLFRIWCKTLWERNRMTTSYLFINIIILLKSFTEITDFLHKHIQFYICYKRKTCCSLKSVIVIFHYSIKSWLSFVSMLEEGISSLQVRDG